MLEHGREETLALLDSLGVKLPASTKLSQELLDSRLSKALDCAQRYSVVHPSSEKIRLKKLKLWKAVSSKSLEEAMFSTSIMEVVQGASSPQGPFLDLRRSMAALGGAVEAGIKTAVFRDDEQKNTIVLHIGQAHALTKDDPLIAISYFTGDIEQLTADDLGVGMFPDMFAVRSTLAQQLLLLKLLELNATRVTHPEEKNVERNSKFIKSFLLSISPLSMQDIGKLTEDVGCIVCGAKGTSRCARCHVVSYCGKVCQKDDWKRHKEMCKPLNSGTWLTVTLGGAPYTAMFNRFARTQDNPPTFNANKNSANIHGDREFVVKVQLGGPTMLIYDRKRSFTSTFFCHSDPEGFAKLEEVVRTGYLGLKVYLWAKRVGENQLSICLDRRLQDDIQW